MATTELLVYGAGGHAKVIIEAWLATGGKIRAVVDDDPNKTQILGHVVCGKYNAAEYKDAPMIIAVGDNRIRKKIAEANDTPFGIVRHPSVNVSPTARIGDGTVLLPGSIVAASTIVGRHVIMNHKSCVDHDCVVGDYVHIAPGATICGEVTICEGVLVGAGSTILPGVRIGKWATVGAGSVIATDIPDLAVVAGVPARVLKYAEPF